MKRRTVRSLRFRLTASYALFFTLLTALSSILFRQFLVTSLDNQARETLEQEWGALKGYLRIERGKPIWYVDWHDPDEAGIGARLKQVYLLANMDGTTIDGSPEFQSLGIDSPADVRAAAASPEKWIEKSTKAGVPYLVRKGLITDEAKPYPRYYIAIGRTLTQNEALLRRFNLLALALISDYGYWR